MNVQVTLTFDTLQAAQVALAKLAGAGTTVETQPEKAADKPAGKPAKTDKPAATQPTASAPAAAPAAPAPAPSTAKTYEQTPIPGLITEYAKTKRAEVAELLKKFGAVTDDGKPKGTLLKPEQYDAFEAALRALETDMS